jgi:hypothetical protein
MSEFSDKVKVVAVKHLKAMVAEIAAEAIMPALKAAAAKSATPIDDMVLVALEAPLKEELAKLLNKLDKVVE